METLCLISIPLIQGNKQHNLTFAGIIKNSNKDNVKVLVTNGYMKGHTNDVPKDYIVDSFIINLN